MDEALERHADLLKRARRAQWATGLCLGLMFLMGLTGIASITLIHDDPRYSHSMGGIEGATFDTVLALKDVISVVHGWGGYVGIVLAGLAGLACFAFARTLRRADKPEWKQTSRWLGPAGLAGAALVTAALLLLIPSGVAASGFSEQMDRSEKDVLGVDKKTGLVDAQRALAEYDDSQMAEWHIREFNYVLAIGALTLVMASAGIRRVSKEARADQSPGSTK